MDIVGRHVIAELWGCNEEYLNDRDRIEKLFVQAALKAGAEVREVVFHQFAPDGVSGVVIISESHLTIHSFPEKRYASIDVYTCGEKMDPYVAISYIIEKLEAQSIEQLEIPRGMGKIQPLNLQY